VDGRNSAHRLAEIAGLREMNFINQGGGNRMLRRLAAALVSASTLALLIGVIHYEPPVGSNIERVQKNEHPCPPGSSWRRNAGKCE
jgi:hypothetical protein